MPERLSCRNCGWEGTREDLEEEQRRRSIPRYCCPNCELPSCRGFRIIGKTRPTYKEIEEWAQERIDHKIPDSVQHREWVKFLEFVKGKE